MDQKNTNSRRFKEQKAQKEKDKNIAGSDDEDNIQDKGKDEENLEDFMSDEEHENFDSQKEDMKQYLNNLNRRIDKLVDTLKMCDQEMGKMGDQKGIIEQIKTKISAKK